MSRSSYTGGQILTDVTPGIKKTYFSLGAMIFFLYSGCAGGAFGIEEMISSAGPGLTLILLVIIPIMWAMPTGLCISELTNLIPAQAGVYVWVRKAFGEFWGFAYGFWGAIGNYLTGAAYVVLATNYIGMYIALSPVSAFLIKTLIIVIFTVINLRGLKDVQVVGVILCLIILAAFAAVTLVGLIHWTNNPFDPVLADGEDVFANWGTGIAIGVWMYCGYDFIAYMGGEIENPHVIPKAMKIAIVLIAGSYILPTLAGIVSVGPWSEWNNTIDYSTVLSVHVGTWAGVAFMIVAVIAQCAIFNEAVAATSRAFITLAQDNLCPKILGKLSPNKGVPVVPIIALACVNMILVNFDFAVLVTILTPIIFVLYIGMCVAFVRLRRDYPVEKRGDLYYVKSKLAPLYILGCPLIIGAISFVVNGTEYFILGFIFIVAAVVFYPIFKWGYGGLYKKDPEHNPINPKTKLAVGDVERFGYFFLLFGAICFLGSFFLMWYEGSWGEEYYLETYATGFMSNFWLMIKVARWAGILMTVLGIILKVVGKKVDPIPEGIEYQ